MNGCIPNLARALVNLTLSLPVGFSIPLCPVVAQQIGVQTPFTTTSKSWYEHTGVSFGFQLPAGQGPGSRVVGWNGFQTSPWLSFQQGGSQSAIPPFGGYDPNAAARFGFGSFNGNGGGFSLGLTMGKGSTRTMTSTVPSLVVQNGQGGGIWSGQVSPFVVGFVPVNGNSGGGPMPLDNGVTRALESGQLDLSDLGQRESSASFSRPSAQPVGFGHANSTAMSAVASISAIKARKERERAAQRETMLRLMSSADELCGQGKYSQAAAELKRAARLAREPEDEQQIAEKIAALPGKNQ